MDGVDAERGELEPEPDDVEGRLAYLEGEVGRFGPLEAADKSLSARISGLDGRIKSIEEALRKAGIMPR